jgi:hypothetical protein
MWTPIVAHGVLTKTEPVFCRKTVAVISLRSASRTEPIFLRFPPKSNDTDRITAVISGTEIRSYHNESTVRIRLCTVKIQPRIRCRITVPARLRENTVRLRRRMKQIHGENTDSRID